MKLDVPYYSQFIDIQDPFWMLRACGGLCFTMVAKYHGVQVPDILTLCNEAKGKGGYDMNNGWVHDYILTKAHEFGLEAYRKEGLTDIKEIVESLVSGNPVIVSVEKRVLEQKRFHMVTVVGYEDDMIIYHETESTVKEKGMYRRCAVETFMQYFRGKAIFITKK
jgi:hypothetical protein